MNIRAMVKGKNIVLLGAGQLGKMALDMWPGDLPHPVLIIDENETGECRGVPIVNRASHTPNTRLNLYVLSYYKDSARNITNTFENWLFQEIVIVYDILSGYNPAMFSNGWAPSISRVSAEAVAACFGDQRSRLVLGNAINWKFDRTLDPCFELSSESEKYSLAKYGQLETYYEHVLDFGSYDGSFLTSILFQGATWGSATAFEPDAESRRSLRASFAEYPALNDVAIEPSAIWSEDGQVPFLASGLLSSRVITQFVSAAHTVPSVSLAQVLSDLQMKPGSRSLMKLHVEGAEFPSLSRAIASGVDLSRFDIFVNLSHDEESLFELPILLSRAKQHTLFLDTHSLFAEGLTLFAKARRS